MSPPLIFPTTNGMNTQIPYMQINPSYIIPIQNPNYQQNDVNALANQMQQGLSLTPVVTNSSPGIDSTAGMPNGHQLSYPVQYYQNAQLMPPYIQQIDGQQYIQGYIQSGQYYAPEVSLISTVISII